MKTKIALLSFYFLLFTSILFAQNKSKKDLKDNSPRHNKAKILQNSTIPNAPQATGDTVSIKDNAGNVLMTITDEGSAGSIKLNVAGIVADDVAPSENKLYNIGGNLYWNGSAISGGSGSADSLNDLDDVIFDNSSLFIGKDSGTNDDGTSNANTAVGKNALHSNTTGFNNTANGYRALTTNTTGHSNTAIGAVALLFNTTGNYNTATGNVALYSNTTGYHNTANGHYALQFNTTGSNNTANGSLALMQNTTGWFNVAYGNSSNQYNQEGSKNTVLGYEAGRGSSLHNKSGNVFLGFRAGYHEISDNKLYINNDSSSSPLIWGDFANDSIKINGNFHVTGNITVDGYGGAVDSLNDLDDVIFDGNRSLFLGKNSGINDVGGTNNTSVGIESLMLNTSGHSNVAVGFHTIAANTTGQKNTAIGYVTLASNTTGNYNTATGYNALSSNEDGDYNTATGNEALASNTTGNNNTAIGNYTLNANITGEDNTAIGHSALTSNISGNNNTAVGSNSLNQNTTGSHNQAIGFNSLQLNTTGTQNTAIGRSSLKNNTEGDNNIAIGAYSLKSNTIGFGNTANGFSSMNNNTEGDNNIAMGYNALFSNTTGSYNIGIGYYTNGNNEKGSKNTIIGYAAGQGLGLHNKSGNVFLGYKAGYYETSDNKLYINNDSSSSPLIWGDFANDSIKINGEFHVTNNSIVDGNLGVGTMNPSDKLEIIADSGQDAFRVKVGTDTKLRVFSNGGTSIGINNSGGTPANGLYVHGDIKNQGGVLHTSDRRFKKNILPILNALEKLKNISGVYYNWKTEKYPKRKFTEEKQIGVIAQDVEKVFPELVNTDSEGYKSVNYSKLTPILIEAIKEQEASIKNQDTRIKTQNERIKTLEDENEKIRLQNAIISSQYSKIRIQNEELKKQFANNSTLVNKVELLEQALNKLTKQQPKIKMTTK